MAKITLTPITNGQNLSLINSNFQAIVDALNAGALWRTNPVGEPNQVNNDVDLNGYNILNLNSLNVKSLTVNGVDVSAGVQEAIDAATAAQASADAANASSVSAAASATSASSIVEGALQKSNNLSDVANVTTAKTNLALQNVDNTSDVNKPVSTAQSTAIALRFLTTNFVAPPAIGSTTPNAATFTTLSTTGAYNPLGGILGRITGVAPTAGQIGERIQSKPLAVAITSSTTTTITTITLTPGCWEVYGGFKTNPAGTTTTGFLQCGINSTGGIPASPDYSIISGIAISASGAYSIQAPPQMFNVSANQTINLVGAVVYAVSTLTVDAFLFAVRRA